MQTSWDIRLREQVERDFKNYLIITLDLSTARTNEAYPVPGDCLYVKSVSSASANATVRFNRNTNEEIELKLHTKIKPDVFTAIFISNAVQAGESMELLVGINFDIDNVPDNDQAEAQPVVVMTNASADTNTVPSAQICDTAEIQADPDNTGKVYIDFGQAAVQGSCKPLDPGDSITVQLSNLNRINANFEVANEKAFVVYEL